MKKSGLLALSFCFVALGLFNLNVALAEHVSTKETIRGRILALRQGGGRLGPKDMEFMVRVVFADAMNSERWANRWVRKHHIPSVTHLVVPLDGDGAESLAFTILRLPERESHRLVVANGFQGNPRVRRWMSVDALVIYFRKLTTGRGEVRLFDAGFLGLKGIRMGIDLKNLLADLHARGLMRTEKEPPLSEEKERENSVLRMALSQELRG